MNDKRTRRRRRDRCALAIALISRMSIDELHQFIKQLNETLPRTMAYLLDSMNETLAKTRTASFADDAWDDAPDVDESTEPDPAFAEKTEAELAEEASGS